MGNRSLVVAFVLAGVCALGLIFLSSWTALVGAMGIGGGVAAYLWRWVGRDAQVHEQNEVVWPILMLLWPLSLPPYLIITRGMRGLLLSAGALFVFGLLPFSFLGAIARQDYVSAKLIDEGQTLSWRQDSGEDENGKEKAMRLFKKAIEVQPLAWRAYMMIFVTEFELKRRETSDVYYRKLQELYAGSWRRTASDGAQIGWYLTSFYYHDFGQVLRLENASDALALGDTRRFVREAREASRHRKEIYTLGKDWRRLGESLTEASRVQYTEELKKTEEFYAYLQKESWKTEKASLLAERVDTDEGWKNAVENYARGLVARSKGDAGASLKYFADAAAAKEEFADPEIMRASIFLDEKRYADAVVSADRAVSKLNRHGTTMFLVSRKAQLSTAYSLAGMGEFYQGRKKAARAALKSAAGQDAESGPVLRLKGLLEQ